MLLPVGLDVFDRIQFGSERWQVLHLALEAVEVVAYPTTAMCREPIPHDQQRTLDPKSGSLKPPVAPEVADNERDERGKRVADHSPCG